MRLVNNLPLLGRNPSIRPTIAPSTLPLSLTSTRDASRLSGIHAGLRRSERARPQGPSPKTEIRQPLEEEPYLSPAERRRARALARRNPLTYKIRKGKKDITEDPGPPRVSRAARFSDPRDPLGQGSLLKKFRTGQLLDELRGKDDRGEDGTLQPDAFAKQMLMGQVQELMEKRNAPVDRKGRIRPWESAHEAKRRTARSNKLDTFGLDDDNRGGGDRFDRRSRDSGENLRDDRSGLVQDRRSGGNRFDRATRDNEWLGEGGRFDRLDCRGVAREHKRDDFAMPNQGRRDVESGRTPARGDGRHDSIVRHVRYGTEEAGDGHGRKGLDGEAEAEAVAEAKLEEKKRKKYEPPPSVPYTTAASQFLYGTSTVEAALLHSRRKLYKLYIYQGSNRRNRDKDEHLAKLAWKRDVRVEYVEENRLPMLDKMSDSRPHNGYVLEASPLPQQPIRALGEVSADSGLPGFNIAPAYQSAEDASVNGTDDFIMTAPDRYKPFVLLLDQVMDPGNLGAILRTACFMGATAVAVSKRGSVPITPIVLKASAGAAETLSIFSVDSPVDFVQESKENGWKVYAAVPPSGEPGRRDLDMRSLEKSDPLLNDPCILVLGSEGEGLSRSLKRAADYKVSIPNLSGSKQVDSLNVSVATGLLCSAFVRGKTQAAASGVEDAGSLF